jgi:hypothetical protein
MLYKFHSKKNNLLSASCKRQWANEKKLSTDVLQARFLMIILEHRIWHRHNSTSNKKAQN